MKNVFSNQFPAILCLILLAIFPLLMLPGCGGGTRGTGDYDSTLSGRVLNSSGKPLTNVQVTQLETGDSVATDSSGNFNLPVVVNMDSVTLLVENNSFSVSTEVNGLDSTKPVNNVVITIDEVSGIIESVDVGAISVDPTPPPTNQVHTQLITGVIVGRNGEGISRVSIKVDGATNGDSTNSQGKFALSTRARSDSVRLQIKYNNAKGAVRISGLPTDRDSEVEVTITLSIESSQPGTPMPDNKELKLHVGTVKIR